MPNSARSASSRATIRSPAATRGPIEDVYPLTNMQRAILVRCVTFPDKPVYMGQWWAELVGPLDEDAFADAWASLVSRHTVLRSAFHWELKDQPFQVVHRQAAFEVERIDWSTVDDWRAALQAFLAEDRARPFDLKRPPLMRVRLIRLGRDRHLVVWTRHHLVVDGWSLGLMLKEVFSAYRTTKESRPSPLGTAIPFRRYVEWERQRNSESAIAYWQKELADFEPSMTATQVGPSSPEISEVVETVDADSTARLAECARAGRLTMNTIVQGAWALVLSRLAGDHDVLFGAVETVRPPHLVEDAGAVLVGMQIDLLPVLARIDTAPLGDWLGRLQASMVEARTVGGIGLDAIREIAGLPRDVPPIESLVGFQNYPLDVSGPIEAAGLTVVDSGDVSLPDMPLNLMVDGGDDLTLRLIFDRRHRDEAEARQILEMLATALRTIPDALSIPAERIDVLPRQIARKVLGDFSRGPDLEVPPPTVPELILRRAEENPDGVAVRYGGRTVRYRTLAATASKIADDLRGKGLRRGARVAIMLERSPEAVAAILGVWLAGGAYVPLDAEGPAERRDVMLVAAGVETVITRASDAADLAKFDPVVCDELVETDLPELRLPELSEADEAYVIFTSGSTGRPKGVVVGHDNLRYHVAARAAAYEDRPIASFLLTFPLIFDGSVTVLSCTLASGGTVVIPEPIEATDPDRLVALIERAGVTHTDMTPALWALVLQAASKDQLASMRLALVAGEACPSDVVFAHYDKLPALPLYNEYGPTEATVWSTTYLCRPDEPDGTVPIGSPIPGTRVYVVDRYGRPCPPGSVGELIVAGPGVARGYLGVDAASSEAFGSNAFSDDAGYARTYRTGDRVAFGFDGRLRFFGRSDNQVKVNGYRIELPEIESCLVGLPQVDEATVVVETTDGRGGRLVAHLGGSDLPTAEEVREQLRRRLPAYMVPQAVVLHDRLPRTRTGKVDRNQLSSPKDSEEAVPPKGDREQALAAIWSDALGRDSVGRNQNFFELGGNSLIAMQVVSRIRRELKLAAELLDLFEAPEIASLAGRLDRAGAEVGTTIERRRRARVELPSGLDGANGRGVG
jgi:amino acid adenylation domain-containing protein